jgi:Flp pilus assembly protein TadG
VGLEPVCLASIAPQCVRSWHQSRCAHARRLQRGGLGVIQTFGLDDMSITMGRFVRGFLKHAFGCFPRVDGCRLLGRLAADQVGSTLVIVAFFVPVLIGVAALGSEVGLWLYTQQLLQAAADSAAISAARMLSSNPSATNAALTTQAEAVTASYCFPNGNCLVNTKNNVTVTVTQISPYTSPGGGTYANAVKVVVQQQQVPLLTNYFSGMYSTPLVITSSAVALAPPETCILALDPSASGSGVTVAFLAAINLTGCSLFTDSTSPNSIEVALLAAITATPPGTIGTKGQVSDFLGFISPAPIQNVGTTVSDPYASEGITTPLPTVPAAYSAPGSCTTISFTALIKSHTIGPGNYCGPTGKGSPITVNSGDSLTATGAGTYVFTDGIIVNNGGQVTLQTGATPPTYTVNAGITVNNGGTFTVSPGTYTLYGSISVSGAGATFNSNSGNYTMTLAPPTAGSIAATSVSNGGALTFGAGTFTMTELTENNGNVTLNGGIYILNSDTTTTPMLSLNGSTLTGTSSTLVFTSSSGKYHGTAMQAIASPVSLTAPTTGPTAGIALFGNNSTSGSNVMPAPGTSFTFDADSPLSVTGSVYLPQGALSFYAFEFSSENCTQIIAYTVTVAGAAYFGDQCGTAGTLPIAAITPQLLQ